MRAHQRNPWLVVFALASVLAAAACKRDEGQKPNPCDQEVLVGFQGFAAGPIATITVNGAELEVLSGEAQVERAGGPAVLTLITDPTEIVVVPPCDATEVSIVFEEDFSSPRLDLVAYDTPVAPTADPNDPPTEVGNIVAQQDSRSASTTPETGNYVRWTVTLERGVYLRRVHLTSVGGLLVSRILSLSFR